MNSNYRVLRVTCIEPNTPVITSSLSTYESRNITELCLQPKLVLAVKFSHPAIKQESNNIDNFTRAVPMRARKTQSLVRTTRPLPSLEAVTVAPLLPPAPVSKPMGWRSVMILLVISMVTIAGVYMLRHYVNTPVSSLTTFEQTKILASTAFTGTVKPLSEVKIAASTPAIIKSVLIKIGEPVKENQPLLTIDDREAQVALTQVKLEKQAAEQQVAELQLNISAFNQRMSALRAKLTAANGRVSVAQRQAENVPLRQRQDSPERATAIYEQAQARYQRAEELYGQGLISAQEFEEARASLKIAEADLNSARAAATAAVTLEQAQETQSKAQNDLTTNEQVQQLADLNGQLQRARLRVEQAKQTLVIAERRLAETTIKATHTGVVVELPVKIGDQIVMGTMLARIAKIDRLIVEVPVNARLVNVLKPGQPAIVSLLTTPPQKLSATIATINPLPAANLNHSVEIEFDNEAGDLLVGQSAEVYFLPPQ